MFLIVENRNYCICLKAYTFKNLVLDKINNKKNALKYLPKHKIRIAKQTESLGKWQRKPKTNNLRLYTERVGHLFEVRILNVLFIKIKIMDVGMKMTMK